MRPKYDMLWKGMIEEIMEDLLLFVDPEIGKELDLERGFEYLDKELAEIYPEPENLSNTRVVDKLVKTFLRDGSERWMLLHIEIQGDASTDFPRRMFEYFIRLYSKYGRPVAAIAVMTGKDGNKMPAVFEDRCLWMRMHYEYKTLRITDYPDEVLERSTNPFALVLLVAKEVLSEVHSADELRDMVLLENKLRIVRLLKERMSVFGEKKTSAIILFLKNYVVFKTSEINRIFMEKADQILEKKKTMGIFEQFAEIKHQEGVEEGKAQEKEKLVRGLLAAAKFSVDEIASLVGVTVAHVMEVKAGLNGK